LATFLVGRFGHQVRRESLSDAGLFVLGLSLLGLSLVAGKMVFLGSLSPLTLISLLSLLMGAAVSMVIVPAQTVLQERSTAEIRGRVLSIYFMVSNMAAIPPMLFMGVIADQVGILPVMTSLAIAVLLLAAFDIWRTRQLRKEAA
jgi:sugar phosphate permease